MYKKYTKATIHATFKPDLAFLYYYTQNIYKKK